MLETDRLILRPVDIDWDFDGFCEAYADPDTMRYLGGMTKSRAQTWQSLALLIGHHHIQGFSFLSVLEKETGAWVGRVGPWQQLGWTGPEVGWLIHPNYLRRGYAKEAAAACLTYVRDVLGWTSVVHTIAAGNIGSEKTALALGSRYLYRLEDGVEGLFSGPCNVYGQNFA